jgi:hypothetical protein
MIVAFFVQIFTAYACVSHLKSMAGQLSICAHVLRLTLKQTISWQGQRGEVSFTARKLIYERALKALPGSYKLWNMYLRERRDRIKHKSITDPAYESLNNTYERALVFMHKMPR